MSRLSPETSSTPLPMPCSTRPTRNPTTWCENPKTRPPAIRMATPRRSVPRREMRWERWATMGQVTNWTMEVTEKIKPTIVVEALNSSCM